MLLAVSKSSPTSPTSVQRPEEEKEESTNCLIVVKVLLKKVMRFLCHFSILPVKRIVFVSASLLSSSLANLVKPPNDQRHSLKTIMANLGTQAAAEIDTQIANFRSLQEELGQYNANFGTLMAQRNENEMVLKELEVCQAEDGEGGESVVYKQVR
jgi:hypothetical protein